MTYVTTRLSTLLILDLGLPDGYVVSPPEIPDGFDEAFAGSFLSKRVAAQARFVGDRPTLGESSPGSDGGGVDLLTATA